MSRHYDPRSLDVAAFARDTGNLSGTEDLSRFERLLDGAPHADRVLSVNWSAAGELKAAQSESPQVWLHLQVEAMVPQVCQRCLATVELPLALRRSFRFAADEAQAAVLDEQLEVDVLVLAQDFNLLDLIEDELVLELPLVAWHEVCPNQPKMSVVDPEFAASTEVAASPFEALAGLKTKSSLKI